MKKNIKKQIGLIAIMFVFGLAALGSGGSTESGTKDIATSDSTEDTPDDNGSETDNVEKSEISIEEQVLLEQDGIKITATGMEEDAIWGTGIKLEIENNTEQNVTVGCNALIVNDYMITDLFASDIAAGKKANETMYMMSSELEAAGISNIGQVEVYFHVYDSDSYTTLFDADVVTIQTSEYAEMDTDIETGNDGVELYNQDGVKIVGKYVDENSFWGTAVLLYIENTSGRKIGITCDDMSVNGYMVSPLFSSTVYDGKKALDDITILSTDLEDNGIETVEDIELNFHIYDVDSYETICDTGSITFSVE